MADTTLAGAAPETTVLVADVGGTNARFAAAGADGALHGRVDYPSADAATAGDLLRRALADLGVRPAAAAIAIAGPVSGGSGRLTNGELRFDTESIERACGCPAVLLNDFEAVASAVPGLGRAGELREIGAVANGAEAGVKAVLGPGTGLGMGVLVPHGDDWLVLPSEGGNADFAPTDALEQELVGILRPRFPTISWETLLSGPGLVNLYRALCELWGARPEHSDPAVIAARGVSSEEPVCHQCLETFCGMLGAAAGNLALTVCARGGVYLAGGILPRIEAFFVASPFRRRFEERGALSGMVESIPTWLVTAPDPGLLGAARRARELL